LDARLEIKDVCGGAEGPDGFLRVSRLPARKLRFEDAVQVSSIVRFDGRLDAVFHGKKKDVKPIVDVVISSNAEQSKNFIV
jgi:hypothetical protein